MRCVVGIDLGSTTTKAIVLGEDGAVLGRGITNSRSNYKVACDVALSEALIDARFGRVAAALPGAREAGSPDARRLAALELRFREQQYRRLLEYFGERIRAHAAAAEDSSLPAAVEGILEHMAGETAELFSERASRRSDFFRDLAGGRYLALAEQSARRSEAPFDRLAGLFDRTILEVENLPAADDLFAELIRAALAALPDVSDALAAGVVAATGVPIEIVRSVGTGYGRATLPFPKDQIRSEILCHGLGAHHLFPGTRTVLDIGGQDTKAIQVDAAGIVTSFQMNDRCAAGCGRYLGYIADEMNLGLHQLGPLALEAKRSVRINSTCTVFAGAELRERLSLGEKREEIVAGLHRAIILRAMSLLARSGGVTDQFTFTGGVAKNPMAVRSLGELIDANYGALTMNISPDSIYTGALGAALFARRDGESRLEGVAA
ncbi:MAG TPA: BadF/BadG/BcrA/BcrD ATPase family protein [Thermoanaerobaculia bacterium]|nr:BadF/BadG/BcrA/BcrD ATPase family protein [Thermoanaerobaculia bacterium]